ncbi:Thymosin beta-11 [Folsomia candida]|uniref:Thymosin beta-11 n=2 Tax=Folsomia candida TaxID=158441 RepID=A0A226DJA7_FOLCA|nr:Thymosin beta-11 [Folsomia candida]
MRRKASKETPTTTTKISSIAFSSSPSVRPSVCSLHHDRYLLSSRLFSLGKFLQISENLHQQGKTDSFSTRTVPRLWNARVGGMFKNETTSTMADTPTLENLPKVDADLKSELEKFKPELMKKASTQEKNPLPSAEDVKQERRHSELIHGVEHFDKEHCLKHAETSEKLILPNAQDVAAEKTQQALLKGVEGFDTNNLKPTETQEKVVLPDNEVIQTEKVQQNLLEGIESFDSKKLKHTETQEKNPLPTKEVIDQEKSV